MLSVQAALEKILAEANSLEPESVPLYEALNRVLANDVQSDIDSPPYDKALMDGYALRFCDVEAGTQEFRVIEEVFAGSVPQEVLKENTTIRIMTGAPIPVNADLVVMVEKTEILQEANAFNTNAQDEFVRIDTVGLTNGKNIMRQGQAMSEGETVLKQGHLVRPVDVGLLAEIGLDPTPVIRRPKVGMLPTGDEIVPPSTFPAEGQIRNSNGPMMLASIERAGGIATDLGVGPDDHEKLRSAIQKGLQLDVLVLSGGVSAGKKDLVPSILAELGVQQIFHKVNLKPGKPIWFGVKEHPEGTKTLVFGLPGNPVSGFVCFELFVRPALESLAGQKAKGAQFVTAQLTHDFHQKGDRDLYHPCEISQTLDGLQVKLVGWQGSPDLRGATRANGLAHLPSGDHQFMTQDSLEVIWL